MLPKDLKLDIKAMTNNQFLAIEKPAENFPYVNGTKSQTAEGWKITIVLPTMKYEKLVVKIPSFDQSLNNITDGGILVNFDNLVISPYISNGNLGLSAKADKVFPAPASK